LAGFDAFPPPLQQFVRVVPLRAVAWRSCFLFGDHFIVILFGVNDFAEELIFRAVGAEFHDVLGG
jgi:hypothetical protein